MDLVVRKLCNFTMAGHYTLLLKIKHQIPKIYYVQVRRYLLSEVH
jgi:hypothetical protein